MKDPLLLACVVSWVGVLGWLGYVVVSTTTELNALEPQLEHTRAEHKRFKAFLSEKRHQEMIRDSLVAQIGVIRIVDGDRYVWSHVLDEVTKALPAYTWLTDMAHAVATGPGRRAAAAPARLRPHRADSVRGPAAPAAVLQHQRPHRGHPGVHQVPPPAGGFAVDHRRDAGLGARRWSRRSVRSPRSPSGPPIREADSAYIRTVPLSQSVR